MKQVILLAISLGISLHSFSQQNDTTLNLQTDTKPTLTKEDYLKKSKKQKKTAWILLGAGAAQFAAGVLIPQGDPTGDYYYVFIEEEYENDDIKGILALTGILTMTASVPFFIVSRKNKKKAVAMSFNMEKATQLHNQAFVQTSFPSLRMQIRF